MIYTNSLWLTKGTTENPYMQTAAAIRRPPLPCSCCELCGEKKKKKKERKGKKGTGEKILDHLQIPQSQGRGREEVVDTGIKEGNGLPGPILSHG